MIESKESKTRDIPIWLTAIVLLLCIGGGGWMIYRYMGEQPRQVASVPDADKGPNPGGKAWKGALAGGNNTQRVQQRDTRDLNADGIQPWGRNSFRVKTGNTQLFVNYTGTSRFDLNLSYVNLRTPEQMELGGLRMSLLQDTTWREYLKLTPEQLEKLRKVPAPVGMKIDPADKARLSELWKAYHDGGANKVAAEKPLLAALDEIGKKNLEPTKQSEEARAEAVRSALTPEQLKAYRDAGGNKPPPPKTGTVPAAAAAVPK